MDGVNNNDIATLGLAGAVGGYGYGRRDNDAGFVGNGALFTAFDGKETRQEVRNEGDQSGARDAFAQASAERKSDRADASTAALGVQMNNLENRLSDKIAANALEAAKCCCETQKLVMSENEKTRTLMHTTTTEELRAQLADAKNATNHAYATAQTQGSLFNFGMMRETNNSGAISK